MALAGVLALGARAGAGRADRRLDPQGRRQLLDLILGLHRTGITLVIISHNMEKLARSATGFM